MIFCTLDNKVAYPSTSDKIKVTYENQFIKDSGSYTYDITFPMAIAANRRIFGNVQRIDVKKNLADFETCRLYAGNRLVMSGKGTVTSITPDKVRVQIVGGKSRIKYNSKFENHYIDEIGYPDIVLDSGVDTAAMEAFGYRAPYRAVDFIGGKALFTKLTSSNIVGQRGVAVYATVNDETNGVLANRFVIMKNAEVKTNGHKNKGNFRIMYNPAPQPYLFYVLGKVVEHEGYTIKRNDLDKDPWNRLVIVSACKSGKIKDALPHWTVYKFFDEFRKLFNASFVFDDTAKTLSITATEELLGNGNVEYECEDDFATESDDDGLDTLSTSNIEYAFDDASERDWRECISQSVLKQYETIEYDSEKVMRDAVPKMTAREKKTRIFKVGADYYIYAELPKDGNPEADETEWRFAQCGFFNPVIRDIDSNESQEIAICPAAMSQRRNSDAGGAGKGFLAALAGNYWIVVPSVTNDKEASVEDMEEDDDGDYYYTVQDAMEGSSVEADDSGGDSVSMPVAFQADCVINMKSHKPVAAGSTLAGEDTDYRIPILYTDYRRWPSYHLSTEKGSLSLENTPITTNRVFGSLYSATSAGRFKTIGIDSKHVTTIKFITDEIPDPSKIYIFRNKRYICQKVEMNVTDDGIDKVKTGYFYELL